MFDVNWLAVAVAVIVAQGLGFLWYGDVLFAKPWMKAIGKTAKQMQANSSPTVYAYSFVGALVMVIVLANVLAWAGTSSILGAVHTAFLMWLGFVATGSAMNTAFEGRSWNLFWINAGYHLVNMVLAAVILTVL